ncbi:hypothetical protein PISMIDRAFT_371965 [Pisolithus microcarpus 441]|uniref:Uncharacterized protein n=1 Tax=Pisolithus microcarpus 441 TaxID=765257 RepID=A0A0C9YAB5_9AGAM|nr:hypothetical protein PISMIDRAFT_371965 [Pisolithus microcarpus 441]
MTVKSTTLRVPIRTVGCSGTLPLSFKSTSLQWKIVLASGPLFTPEPLIRVVIYFTYPLSTTRCDRDSSIARNPECVDGIPVRLKVGYPRMCSAAV